MRNPFTVAILDDGPVVNLHRSIIASLPDHFRMVDTAPADAMLIASAARVEQNAAVAVVDISALVLRNMPATPAILPAYLFLPRLAAAPLVSHAATNAWALVDIVTTIARQDDMGISSAVVEQLAIIRFLTGKRAKLGALRRLSTGYVATATVEGSQTVCSLAAVKSPVAKDAVVIHAIAPVCRLHAELDADAIARTGVIRMFGPGGNVTEAAPIYQHSYRLAWLRAYALLTGERPADQRDELLEDVEEAQRCFRPDFAPSMDE